MLNLKSKNYHLLTVFTSVLISVLIVFSGCSNKKAPAWKAVNDKLIKENNIQVRERSDMPETGITPNLQEGKVTSIDSVASIEIAPGVTSKVYWGKGAMVSIVTMLPNSEIPTETLASERLMVMMQGTVEQLVGGQMVKMQYTPVAPMYYYSTGYLGSRDCLFLEKGAENSVKAGADTVKFVEVYSPVRLDYMTKAGATAPEKPNFPAYTAKPNFPSNQIFNYYDIQRTELVPDAWSKLFNGTSVQASMLFMEPGSKFGHHNHPEEQIMLVLNGTTDEIVLDGTQPMKQGDIVYFPSNMVHGGINGEKGVEVLDVFWPVRPDYQEKYDAQLAKYNAIIPAGETPKFLAEGFKFTEGPTWLNGTLYFSSMFFDIPAGTWKTDAKKSDLIAMKPDGTWKAIWKGKTQTNGLIANYKTNTIIACDMSGHKIVEIDETGKLLKVVATKLADGTRLDGPNDLVLDAKGGIYFTDPQFIFDKPARPGKTVNYMKPTGEVIEIIPPGEFGMGNGVELSPDGKTLYVNNTYHDANRPSEMENWFGAYDVNEDGTVTNKRKFGRAFLPESEYFVAGTRSTCMDGSCVDQAGNIYQATNIGLQIFDNTGKYIGTVFTPTFPVSVAFGGDNLDTLYMTCWDKVYSIKTNMKGLVYPLGGEAPAAAPADSTK